MDSFDFHHHTRSKRSESSLASTISSSHSLCTPRRSSRPLSNVTSCSSSSPVADSSCMMRPTAVCVALPNAAAGIAKARRIRLYRNGDTFFGGIVVVLAAENFRTFDSLLTYINRLPIADPSVLKKVGGSFSAAPLCRSTQRKDFFIVLCYLIWCVF